MKRIIILLILFPLFFENIIIAQESKFNFKHEREKIEKEISIDISQIDSINITIKTTKAITGFLLKDPVNKTLLDYLKITNSNYYDIIKPKGDNEGTGCTLYINPKENYVNNKQLPKDIIFHLCTLSTETPNHVFIKQDSDARYWVDCQILIITMYQGHISKNEYFVLSMKVLGKVDKTS